MSDTVATTNPNTNVMTLRLFLPHTVIRDHKVFHNQDLMTIIGKYLMPVMKNRGSFIRVCRLWRHVFYTRLIANSLFQLSVRKAIFSHACTDACVLFMDNVPKVPALMMDDIRLILKSTRQSTAIAELLWQLPRETIPSTLRIFYNLIASPVNFSTNRWLGGGTSFILEIACMVLQVDAVPESNLAGMLKFLGPDRLFSLFSYVCMEDPSRIHLLLPHIKIDVKEFICYVYSRRNRIDIPSQFEAICRAFATDVYVDHYVGVLAEIHINPINMIKWIDIYLRIGSELPNFAVELFKSQSCHSRTAINRFILMGYVNPWLGTKYKFDVNQGSMTIFQYATYAGNDEVYYYIVKDPRFKVREHLNILPFAIVRNRYMIAMKFLKECKLDKEELEEGLRLVLEAKAVSKRNDVSYFDKVIKKIEKKLSMIGSRKKVKKDTK
jgi:hypothetical protein